jgi:sarcosine oxidase subunit beta
MAIPGAAHHRLRSAYDVVVVGAGLQGVALAYELSELGISDVAVLDAAYPGSGASGRNGEMIRSAFSSREWTRLFDLSLQKWHGLSAELDFNVLFTRAGYLILASTPGQLSRLRADAKAQAELGVRTQLLDAAEVREVAPCLSPVTAAGGLLQPDGGFAHHDAVLWGYARAAARNGVEIHPYTTVTGISSTGGRVRGVLTDRGEISTAVVVDAAGAFARDVAALAGVDLPTQRYRLEIMVTDSLQPFLRPAVASLELMGYCHQTSRGEFVGGTEYRAANPADDLNVTVEALRDMATKFVRLIPRLAGARVVRHWAGLVDQPTDLSPVVGPVPELEGFYLDCGWMYGFMGAPGAAYLLARTIAEDAVDPIIEPFGVDRLRTGRLIQEGALVVPLAEART